jgi:NodT family efflux transporter outer membrane factor (OMF) lipoprotein
MKPFFSVRAAAIALVAASAACTVGPDHVTPEPPNVDRFTSGPQPSTTIAADGVAQTFVARDVPADWWTLFESPVLDQLVREALANSPTLDEARARLFEASEGLASRSAALHTPTADLSAGISRNEIDPESLGFPGAGDPGPFTLYHVGVDVAYTVDVFGGTRRELESQQAFVDVRAHELAATRLALTANVVTAAIRQAHLRAEIESVRAIHGVAQRELAIAEQRRETGALAEVDVQLRRARVAEAAAALAPLQRDLEQALHALALFCGVAPGESTLATVTLADLTLPRELPFVLPAELVRQRPDVRASEARLHEASARIGVAEAAFYPSLTLSGSVATDRTHAEDIFDSFNVWHIGARLVQPLLRRGELDAEERRAIAGYQASLAAYRQAVLVGFVNVADALRALEQDAHALAARANQARAAESVRAITAERERMGAVSQIDVLATEREALEAARERSRAAALRLADSAALLHALGGGWWMPDAEGR